MHARLIAGCLFVLAPFTHPAFAQSTINGTITDPQSAVILDARVTLLAGQSEVRSTRTDAQGRYRFDAVPAGTYVVMASAPGFQPATGAEISVTAGQGATRDLSLALAGATDFVSVEGVYAALPPEIDLSRGGESLDSPVSITIPGLGIPGSAASVTIKASRVEWGVTIPVKSRNRENAVAFVASLLGAAGSAALTTNGPAPLRPARVTRQDFDRLPQALRNLTKKE